MYTFKILLFGAFLMSFTTFKAQNQNISELFKALENRAVSETDLIKIKQAEAYKENIKSQHYPIIDGFGKYDYSSIPSGMYPVPPNDLFPLIQNQNIAQPFSSHIFRMGIGISMPVFNKSLNTMSQQANYLVNSAKEQQKINLIKNQAVILANNANLQYIENLSLALEKKRQSLEKTKEIITVKVRNGRSPGALLYNIDNSLNEISLTLDELQIQKNEIKATLLALTGISIQTSYPMELIEPLEKQEIGSTRALQEKIKANEQLLKAEKEKRLPSVLLQSNYTYNFAPAYNNDKGIGNDLLLAGIMVKVPIFDKSLNAKINSQMLQLEESQNELAKMNDELEAQKNQLQENLVVLENSKSLYENTIANKEQLRQIAIKSYEIEQMSIEDYLKYEDDVVLEKARLYKNETQRWQIIAKLAVIYGIDLNTIVK